MLDAVSPAPTFDEKSTLTAEVLRNLLSYDAETGIFTWIGKPNGRVAHGAQAGTFLPDGYVRIKLRRKLYLAHRLAWFYVHGVWPENEIDHINRVTAGQAAQKRRSSACPAARNVTAGQAAQKSVLMVPSPARRVTAGQAAQKTMKDDEGRPLGVTAGQAAQKHHRAPSFR